MSLGGWQLKHVSGEDETVYKFHRSVNIKAGEHVTVSTRCRHMGVEGM